MPHPELTWGYAMINMRSDSPSDTPRLPSVGRQTTDSEVTSDLGETPGVPVALPDHELPPLPAFLDGPSFGADRDGKPIRHITGVGVIAAIRHMQDYVG